MILLNNLVQTKKKLTVNLYKKRQKEAFKWGLKIIQKETIYTSD